MVIEGMPKDHGVKFFTQEDNEDGSRESSAPLEASYNSKSDDTEVPATPPLSIEDKSNKGQKDLSSPQCPTTQPANSSTHVNGIKKIVPTKPSFASAEVAMAMKTQHTVTPCSTSSPPGAVVKSSTPLSPSCGKIGLSAEKPLTSLSKPVTAMSPTPAKAQTLSTSYKKIKQADTNNACQVLKAGTPPTVSSKDSIMTRSKSSKRKRRSTPPPCPLAKTTSAKRVHTISSQKKPTTPPAGPSVATIVVKRSPSILRPPPKKPRTQSQRLDSPAPNKGVTTSPASNYATPIGNMTEGKSPMTPMQTLDCEQEYSLADINTAFTPIPPSRNMDNEQVQQGQHRLDDPPSPKRTKNTSRDDSDDVAQENCPRKGKFVDGKLEEPSSRLETVDSELFDAGPFKPNYVLGGTTSHSTTNPFEISTTPIEINESRNHKTIEIQNRARLESQNDACLSPNSVKSILDELEPRCKSPQQVEMHTFRDAVDVNYQRMAITGEDLSGVPLEDLKTAAGHLIEALRLRSEYMEKIGNQFPATTRNFLSGHYPNNLPRCRVKNTESTVSTSFNPPEPPKDHWGLLDPLPKYPVTYTLKRVDGVIEIRNKDGVLDEKFKKFYHSKEQFLADTEKLTSMIVDGPLKSFCFRRLSYLQNKFQLHVLLNELRELHEQKGVSHRDFYNIRKVDTHIHAASSMNQKHLLRFIKKKMKTEANTVVMEKDGKPVTMKDLFKKMGIDAYDLSVDMLDVHADRNTFHRFDKFNTKYNPVGESTLREIFIKTDNYVGGKYFAEVLKEVLSDLEDSKYQHSEPRLSIYGRSKNEWDALAKWAITHDVWSPNVRWLIQIPRLYDIYRTKNMVQNFDEILDNIFTPLFEVTNDPSSHPMLHRFLQQVSGIDSVDDESKHEFVHFDRSTPTPPNYKDTENPPYNYYLFYMYANITALNAFRRERGMNTFALRPHCGEAGHISHLLAGYLTSESIAHGILLRKVPVLQYLFYLTQMGIAMSPLSNNSLFISYQRNPLPEYLQKGLNVSLSTDDPLQFHYTKEALMEEFSIAAQVWKLSSCDMCELARNSVNQSGFEDKVKIHWLGPNYREDGVLGNDIHRTNVPDIRVSFRHEALVDELTNLFRVHDLKRPY